MSSPEPQTTARAPLPEATGQTIMVCNVMVRLCVAEQTANIDDIDGAVGQEVHFNRVATVVKADTIGAMVDVGRAFRQSQGDVDRLAGAGMAKRFDACGLGCAIIRRFTPQGNLYSGGAELSRRLQGHYHLRIGTGHVMKPSSCRVDGAGNAKENKNCQGF